MNPVFKKVLKAAEKDPDILSNREDLQDTVGQDHRYLKTLGLDKSDLIRLERLGLALKCRYVTKNKTGRKVGDYEVTGPHRVRWVIFMEALNVNS